LKGYIPDFIITFPDTQVLVEIKGEMNIWDNYKSHYEKVINSGWIGKD
jgi:predicted nuclease of restriction endonuclease-like RecB superfamily